MDEQGVKSRMEELIEKNIAKKMGKIKERDDFGDLGVERIFFGHRTVENKKPTRRSGLRVQEDKAVTSRKFL